MATAFTFFQNTTSNEVFGISGVKTAVCSWKYQDDEVYGKGAQVDLLIDRADDVVNVCEMKYSSGEYVLNKAEFERIDNKMQAFRTVTHTAKSVFRTIVTVVRCSSYMHWM